MNERIIKFVEKLKNEEQAQSRNLSVQKESNQSVMTLTEDNNQQTTGGKIMGRFSNRVSQYPGRIKLTKVRDEGNGTVYDCVAAEGTVSNAGTPLDADTLNAFENELKASMKLYRHRVRLTGSSTNGVTPVGVIEVYTTSGASITSASALASALGITSSTDVPACGCKYSGNNTILITGAEVSTYGVYLYGMHFGYSSGNGTIQRVSASVSSITDSVTQII